MVSKSLPGSVLNKIKTDPSGGSSSVFRKIFAAEVFIRSAPMNTATLCAASIGFKLMVRTTSRDCAALICRDLFSGRTQVTSA